MLQGGGATTVRGSAERSAAQRSAQTYNVMSRQAYVVSGLASYSRNAGVHLARPLLDHQVLVRDAYRRDTVIPNNSTGSLNTFTQPARKRQSEGLAMSFHKLERTPAGKDILAQH